MVGPSENELTVGQLTEMYMDFAEEYYRKPRTRRPTGHATNMRHAMSIPVELHADLPAEFFGLQHLEECRDRMIDLGLCRRTINGRIGRIRQVFKWAIRKRLIRSFVLAELQVMEPLRYGRSRAPEGRGMDAVDRADVEASLPFMEPAVASLVRLMLWTGMRVSEALTMRTADVNQSEDPWQYRPYEHKTEHFGHARVIGLGPRCQSLLADWLRPYAPEDFLFALQPDDDDTALGADHSTPIDRDALRRRVHRACVQAGVKKWTPLQLRHTAALRVYREYGVEHARDVLGHRNVSTTMIYVPPDLKQAMQAMSKLA